MPYQPGEDEFQDSDDELFYCEPCRLLWAVDWCPECGNDCLTTFGEFQEAEQEAHDIGLEEARADG